MDGTKRTAFLAALYFLHTRGHRIPIAFPQPAVIEYCVALAEENARRIEDSTLALFTVEAIADWLRDLLAGEVAGQPEHGEASES